VAAIGNHGHGFRQVASLSATKPQGGAEHAGWANVVAGEDVEQAQAGESAPSLPEWGAAALTTASLAHDAEQAVRVRRLSRSHGGGELPMLAPSAWASIRAGVVRRRLARARLPGTRHEVGARGWRNAPAARPMKYARTCPV
jgi:hypothetical protein